MPDATNDMGLKIIHWEYAKLEKHITNVELFMKIFCVVQPETNIKNGLLFRFVARLYDHDLLCVNCIAENVFINTAISSFAFDKMKSLMQQAFDKFGVAFSSRISDEGHTGTFLNYTITTADALTQVKRVSG